MCSNVFSYRLILGLGTSLDAGSRCLTAGASRCRPRASGGSGRRPAASAARASTGIPMTRLIMVARHDDNNTLQYLIILHCNTSKKVCA